MSCQPWPEGAISDAMLETPNWPQTMAVCSVPPRKKPPPQGRGFEALTGEEGLIPCQGVLDLLQC